MTKTVINALEKIYVHGILRIIMLISLACDKILTTSEALNLGYHISFVLIIQVTSDKRRRMIALINQVSF